MHQASPKPLARRVFLSAVQTFSDGFYGIVAGLVRVQITRHDNGVCVLYVGSSSGESSWCRNSSSRLSNDITEIAHSTLEPSVHCGISCLNVLFIVTGVTLIGVRAATALHSGNHFIEGIVQDFSA